MPTSASSILTSAHSKASSSRRRKPHRNVLADNRSGADSVADLMAKVELVQRPRAGKGTLTFNADGTFRYDAGQSFQHLAAGAVEVVTISYRVMDADGQPACISAILPVRAYPACSTARIAASMAASCSSPLSRTMLRHAWKPSIKCSIARCRGPRVAPSTSRQACM